MLTQEFTQEFLAKFNVQPNRLPHYGMELKAHPMEYPFLLRHFFCDHYTSEKELEYFHERLLQIIFFYMEEWVLITNRDGKQVENTHRHMFEFPQIIKAKEAYETVTKGEDSYEIHVPLNNSSLEVKRFGNCLGARVKSDNSQGGMHEKGTSAMIELVRKKAPYVSEFLHRIECVIPLARRQTNDNSIDVDFGDMHAKLKRACPYLEWVSPADYIPDLIDGYIKKRESATNIGKCHDIEIQAQLLHHNKGRATESLPWRKGNVECIGNSSYNFSFGDDLCLSIFANSGLPVDTLLTKIDTRLDATSHQNHLAYVGSIIYLQLLSMAMETELNR